MSVTTRQTAKTRETNRKRDVHERRVRGHDVLARRQREFPLGVRAADLNAAFANSESMSAQSPTVPLQKVILQRMRVVPPDDLTARDQALWQMMIAIWRDDVDKNRTPDDGEHVIPFEIARTYLYVDDDRQIVDSMHRLGKTLITFDVETTFFKSLGTMAMVLGYVRIDKRSGQKTIRFTVPEQLQKILGSCLHYAYIELAAWPKFQSKFSGRLYGFLASYRPMNLTGGIVTVDVPLAELQDILGGGDAQRSRYGSWKRRVLVPAIMGVIDSAKRLTIDDWSEKRGPGSGSPVASVSFSVKYAGAKVPEICPNIPDVDRYGNQIAKQVISELNAGDPIHPSELLPTAQDVGRTIRALHEITGEYAAYHFLVRGWPHALDEAFYGIVSNQLDEPSADALCGAKLRKAVESKGVRTAFATWCASEIKTPRYVKLCAHYGRSDDWRTEAADAIRRGEIPDGFKRAMN